MTIQVKMIIKYKARLIPYFGNSNFFRDSSLFNNMESINTPNICKSLIITALILISSCVEEVNSDFKDIGTITGEDFRRCMCCGGWFIDINSETYRFDELPENSNLDLNIEEFPLQVYVDWIANENACLGDEIIIEQIEKVTP